MPAADYYYRRSVGGLHLLPALGAGLAAGAAGFYIALLLMQRVPMTRESELPLIDERGTRVRRPSRLRREMR